MAKAPKMKSINEISEPVQTAQAPQPEQTDEIYSSEIYSEVPGTKIETPTLDFDSHLFKLNVANIIKNTGLYSPSPDHDPSQFMHLEHTHIFRTRDSEGRIPTSTIKSDNPKATLMRSTPIAGHFHLVEMIPHPTDPTKPPVITKISGPMTMGKEKIKGRWQQVEVALNDYDFHVHKVTYHSTEKVKVKAKNMEAQKVIAWEAQKGAAPAGVIA